MITPHPPRNQPSGKHSYSTGAFDLVQPAVFACLLGHSDRPSPPVTPTSGDDLGRHLKQHRKRRSPPGTEPLTAMPSFS
jgi:hypothetical protein